MSDRGWQRLNELFEAAAALDPREREAFLEEACGEDETLRADVRSLLSADADADGFLAEGRRSLLPRGALLGDYEIVALLGSGGMGQVYTARDSRLERDVAVKVLAEDVARDRFQLQRFEREARAAGALNHPNIVHVYQVGSAQVAGLAVSYIAMELVDGETLRARLRAGDRWPTLLEPLAQVADALARAHGAGIVHRDLKPENIMISTGGWAKVLDFGLAKRTALESGGGPTSEVTPPTRPGTVLGTPGYMSPEQVKGLEVDHRTDVFAFGCTLHEAITGRAPFRRDSAVDTLHAIVHDSPPGIDVLEVRCPPALVAVVGDCLAKDPGRRCDSMAAVAVALRAVSTAEFVPTVTTVAAPPRESRRGRIRWVAVASALVALGVAVVSWQTPRRAPQQLGPLAVEKLTSRGDVHSAALSPDGEYLAFTTRDEAGASTVWRRDLDQGAEVRLAGPFSGEAQWFFFSPDGRQIFYVSGPRPDSSQRLHTFPIIGGETRLIHSGGFGYAVSPDASRLSFMRDVDLERLLFAAPMTGEKDARIGPVHATLGWSPDGSVLLTRQDGKVARLFLASPDGAVHHFADVPPDHDVHDPCLWDPTGERLLVVAGKRQQGSGDEERLLAVVDREGGFRRLGDHAWSNVWGAEWLPALPAVLVEGDRRLWLVTWPEGRTRELALGTASFSSVSASRDGARVAAVQHNQWSEIVVRDEYGEGHRVLEGTDTRHDLAWAPDGRLIVSAADAGSYDLYVLDESGGPRRRLTFTEDSDERHPSVCGDGRHVVFEKRGEEDQGLWRVALDGTGLKQITFPRPEASRDSHAQCSPDGRRVVFTRWDPPTLWTTTIEGETPRPLLPEDPVLEHLGFGAGWSPGGERLAFFQITVNKVTGDWSEREIAIASPDGQPLGSVPYNDGPDPAGIRDDERVQWSPDGQTLFYHLYTGAGMELWSRPAGGGGTAEPVPNVPRDLRDFEWSNDGARLAYSGGRTLSDAVLITGLGPDPRRRP